MAAIAFRRFAGLACFSSLAALARLARPAAMLGAAPLPFFGLRWAAKVLPAVLFFELAGLADFFAILPRPATDCQAGLTPTHRTILSRSPYRSNQVTLRWAS
jgi:hypothetical protein